MSVSPALQALSISIRNISDNGCELLAHYTMDNISGVVYSRTDYDSEVIFGRITTANQSPSTVESQTNFGKINTVNQQPSTAESHVMYGTITGVSLS